MVTPIIYLSVPTFPPGGGVEAPHPGTQYIIQEQKIIAQPRDQSLTVRSGLSVHSPSPIRHLVYT